MSMIVAALKAAFSYVSVLGKLGFLFKWMGPLLSFMGPLGPILGAVVSFVGQIISWALEGLTVIISKPVTLVTVALIATAMWAIGLRFGLDFDHAKIVARDQRIAAMEKQWKDRDDKDRAAAKAAIIARDKAEGAAASAAAAPAAPAGGDPVGVPKRKRAVAKTKHPESVWGLSSVFGGSK